MKGLGPYVINEINVSRAVRLETFNGKPMANYINGIPLKRYEEPLREETLQ